MKKQKTKRDLNRRIKQAKSDGITLIALVITIIVLLILASIVLTFVLGDQGIIQKTRDAARNYINAQGEEETDLAKLVNDLNGDDVIGDGGNENPGGSSSDKYPIPGVTPTDPSIFEYRLNDMDEYAEQTITITGVKPEFVHQYYSYTLDGVKTIDRLVVPFEIDGYKVTAVGWGLDNIPNLAEEVIFPEGVTSIGGEDSSLATTRLIIPGSCTYVNLDCYDGVTSIFVGRDRMGAP